MLATHAPVVQACNMHALFAAIIAPTPDFDSIISIIDAHYSPLVSHGDIPCLLLTDEAGYTPLGRAALRYQEKQEPIIAYLMTILACAGKLSLHASQDMSASKKMIKNCMEVYLQALLNPSSYPQLEEYAQAREQMLPANAKRIEQIIFEKYLLGCIHMPNFRFFESLRESKIQISDDIYSYYAQHCYVTFVINAYMQSEGEVEHDIVSLLESANITSKAIMEWFIVLEHLKNLDQKFEIEHVDAQEFFITYLSKASKVKKICLISQIRCGQIIPKQLIPVIKANSVRQLIEKSRTYQIEYPSLYLACLESSFCLEDLINELAPLYMRGLFTSPEMNKQLLHAADDLPNGITCLCRRLYSIQNPENKQELVKSLRIGVILLSQSGGKLQVTRGTLTELDKKIKSDIYGPTSHFLTVDACNLLYEIIQYQNSDVENLTFLPAIQYLSKKAQDALLRILTTQLEFLLAYNDLTFFMKEQSKQLTKKRKIKLISVSNENALSIAAWCRLSIALADREVNLLCGKKLYEFFADMYEHFTPEQHQLLAQAFDQVFIDDSSVNAGLRNHSLVKRILGYEQRCMEAELLSVELMQESKKIEQPAKPSSKPKKKAKSKPISNIENQGVNENLVAELYAVMPHRDQENLPTINKLEEVSVIELTELLPKISLVEPLQQLPRFSAFDLEGLINKLAQAKSDSSDAIKHKMNLLVEVVEAINLQFSCDPNHLNCMRKLDQRVLSSNIQARREAAKEKLLTIFSFDQTAHFEQSPEWYWNQAIKAMMQGVLKQNTRSVAGKESAAFYNAMISTLRVNLEGLAFISELLSPCCEYFSNHHALHKIYLGGGQAQQLVLDALEIPLQSASAHSDYDVSFVIALPEGVVLDKLIDKTLLKHMFRHADVKAIRDLRSQPESECDYSISLSFAGKEVDIALYVDPDLVIRNKRIDSFKSALVDISNHELSVQRDHLAYTLAGKRFFNETVFSDRAIFAYFIREIGRNRQLAEKLPLCDETFQKYNQFRNDSSDEVQRRYRHGIAWCLTKYVRTFDSDLFEFLLSQGYLQLFMPRLDDIKQPLLTELCHQRKFIDSFKGEEKNYFVLTLLLTYQYLSVKCLNDSRLYLASFPRTLSAYFYDFQQQLTQEAGYLRGPQAWRLDLIYRHSIEQSRGPVARNRSNLWLPAQPATTLMQERIFHPSAW